MQRIKFSAGCLSAMKGRAMLPTVVARSTASRTPSTLAAHSSALPDVELDYIAVQVARGALAQRFTNCDRERLRIRNALSLCVSEP